jgi:hypothetical protein
MEALRILEKPEHLTWEYDEEGDVLYISVGEPRPAVTIDLGESILARYDEETRRLRKAHQVEDPLLVLKQFILDSGLPMNYAVPRQFFVAVLAFAQEGNRPDMCSYAGWSVEQRPVVVLLPVFNYTRVPIIVGGNAAHLVALLLMATCNSLGCYVKWPSTVVVVAKHEGGLDDHAQLARRQFLVADIVEQQRLHAVDVVASAALELVLDHVKKPPVKPLHEVE